MKRKILTIAETKRFFTACAVAALICLGFAETSRAQTPADMSPALERVVNFAKGGMSDDFILNYITNSGSSYTVSDDDIIYMHKQGVSDTVIKALMQTTAPATTAPQPAPTPTATGPGSSTPVPPPLDAGPSPSPADSAPSAPAMPAPAPSPMPAPSGPGPVPAGLQDSFFADGGLSPVWQTQSGILSSLASLHGRQVLPELVFSPSGMQMSGIRGSDQFMGIQSVASFVPPFNFSVTVTGLAQDAIPFQIYLVSGDLQQWLSIAGHLGGRGGPRSHLNVGAGIGHVFGDFRIPLGGSSADYGVWLNHTGGGWPIQALGYKFMGGPLAGVPYTIQVSAGADGAASVSMLDPGGMVLAAQNVPVGMGPFYVVLAGRDGRTFASWQSVQLTPAAPPAPVAPVAVAAPVAPPVPTLDYFQSQLAPYGNWLTLPGYGLCWQPAVAPGWRPYYDGGSWTYTDAGWYWQSEYPWGDLPFHYGRWAYTAAGWVWVPGYDYAPSWVVWRHADADGYMGWAPLPPGALFVDGGWRYNGVRVGADFDFGLGVGFFTFVPNDHFWEHDFRRFVVPHDRVAFFYRHSVIENRYRYDHGVFINVGLGRDRIAVLTHRDAREIRAMDFHDVRRREEDHNFAARREDIHEFHPGARPDARGFGGPNHGPEHGPDRGPVNNHEMNHGGPSNQKGAPAGGERNGNSGSRDKKPN